MPIQGTSVNDAASALMLMHQRTFREIVSVRRAAATAEILAVSNAAEPQQGRNKRTVDTLDSNQTNVETQDGTKRRRLNSRGLHHQQRSVRFAPMVQTYAHDQVEAHEASQVWWSRKEIGHIHRRERSLVKILSCLCPIYVQQLSKLVQMASREGTVDRNNDDATVPIWIGRNPGRGLEMNVIHILGGSAHNPKRVIREVLDTHFQLQEYGDMIGPAELRSQILRAKCERLSRNKVEVAQLLAYGDAKVAQLE